MVATRRAELISVLEPLHPIGDPFDVTRDGRVAYVEFEQGRSELWLGDYVPD